MVEVLEELVKFAALLRDRQAFLVDRYSERKERAEQPSALEQGKDCRAESTTSSQRYLGHSGQTPARGEDTGFGTLQLGYRQQTACV